MRSLLSSPAAGFTSVRARATAPFAILMLVTVTLCTSALAYEVVGEAAEVAGDGIQDSGFGFLDFADQEPCLTPEQRGNIAAVLAASRTDLQARGILPSPLDRRAQAKVPVTLDWVVRAAAHVTDPGVQGISNFVDQDAAFPDQLLDWNCGARTYDLSSGYNHAGTDIFTWPFGWHKMDNDDVEIVSGADGVILSKSDGNYDRNCGFGGGNWNAVYIEHSDGSVAWYGHMKSGSTTTKPVGAAVSAGEYLGIVGSSGNSTGPHLHLELYDPQGNLVDPYAGSCNSLNAESLWNEQPPYYDSGINALSTNSQPVAWQSCPNPAVKNEQTQFYGGDLVYFTMYLRDQRANQRFDVEILQPDGSTWTTYDISMSSPDHYAASWWWASYNLPADPQNGRWTYRVTFGDQVVDHDFQVGEVTSVPVVETAALVLRKPHPNPFNPVTTISFSLAHAANITMDVFDLRGQRVATLLRSRFAAGDHSTLWNGQTSAGRAAASGVYFVRVSDGHQTRSQRLVLAK